MKKKILAVLAGAVVAFIWSTISWMALPWHNLDFKSFEDNGKPVEIALKSTVLQKGIYIIPNFSDRARETSEGQAEWHQLAEKGPFAYMVVNPQGKKLNMGRSILIQFLTLFLAAIFLVFILSWSNYQRVWQAGLIGAFALGSGALLCNVPNWNWWSFPICTTLVNIADLTIQGFLSGLVMGKCLR